MSPFAWWRRILARPMPVPRPKDYAVEGEAWPAYVPSEPMPHRQAQGAEWIRNRMAVDDGFRQRVEGMRGRR